MAFGPGKDPDILGGAVQMVAMKVNPATQSSLTLANAYGNAVTLTSEDYGAFTSQINITVAAATAPLTGKLVTIYFEDDTEAVDGLGGDAVFSITYVNPGTGWTTITAEVESTGAVVCDATRTQAGLDSEVTAQLAGSEILEVVSASGLDTTQQVVLYGLNGAGAAQTETLTLNGATAVIGSTYTRLLGARVVGTTNGIVTIRVSPGGATVATIAAGADKEVGLSICSCMYVGAGALTAVSSGASVKSLMLIGYSTTGAAQIEKITLTGVVPVAGASTWSEITYLGMLEVEAAQTITFSGEAARTVPATHDTLQKVADYFNARAVGTDGFDFTLATGQTALDPANLDVTTGAGGAVTCLSPAEPDFYADLYALINWINTESDYVTAVKVTGAKGGTVSNTVSPQYLSGGVEGTTLAANWQAAFNLLKKMQVSTVVPLTGDPAIHAQAEAHAAYMCGIGRGERDVVVGLLNTAKTDVPTKAEIKSQIINLNSRHVRAVAQAIDRYNSAGEREEFTTYYHAAVIAGMQAGSPVGTSLSRKYANVLALRQDSSWNPTDDAEEMIQAGLCFMENVEGVGRRVVRNITTYLTSSNLAYQEASVNEAVNYSVYNFRTNLEIAVGKRGFSGTVSATKGVAITTLGLLKDEGILVASRSLDIELVLDVLDVSVELAPVLPINFVKSTIHLVTVPQTAV